MSKKHRGRVLLAYTNHKKLEVLVYANIPDLLGTPCCETCNNAQRIYNLIYELVTSVFCIFSKAFTMCNIDISFN